MRGGPPIKDLTGQTFGRLTVIGQAGRARRAVAWKTVCACGREFVVDGTRLRSGEAQSCGCVRRRHGQTRTREWNSWQAATRRCLSPTAHAYEEYGGRGITICDRWQGEHGFENFLADMGPRPRGTSLDRKDVNGPYSPENCRWATPTEQNANRRDATILEHDGECLHILEWSKRTGLSEDTIRARLKANWSIERALTSPARRYTRSAS